MALGDLLKELGAGIRGVGEGVSIGLTRYPAARALQATRFATEGESIPYEEALRIVREQEAQAEQETPVATYGGRLVGTLLGSPGAAVGKTVGKTLLSAAGRGAVQGGVSGFTANEGMENVGRDVALGALTGGTLSALGAGVSKGTAELARKRVIDELNATNAISFNRVKQRPPEEISDFNLKLGDLSKKLKLSKDETLIALSSGSPINPRTGKTFVKSKREAFSNVADQYQPLAKDINMMNLNKKYRDMITEADPEEALAIAKQALPKFAAVDVKSTLRKIGQEFVPGAIGGAGLGAAYGALSPDQDLATAALLGAGAGGGWQAKAALGQLIPKIAIAGSTLLPTAAGETAGRLATRTVVPTLVDRPKTAAPAVTQPAGLTDEQLRMLNEEFDALPESDASTVSKPAATKSPAAKSSKFDYSNEYGVPPELLQGVHRTESAFGAKMKSKAGAEGHFQFMPATAKEYGLQDPYDFEQSKQAAARKLSDLHKEYGNWEEALQAYNAGQGTLKKVAAGQKPMPKETLGYVAKVKGYSAEELKKINDEFDALP